jgi:hypothetical protein
MSNNTYRNLPSNKVPSQYFTTTNALAADIKNYPRTTTVADNTAAEDILADSVWRIDAQDHQNEGMPAKKVRNLGTAGPILDCTSGSTSVADSNDPKFLDWIGTNYVYLPGVAGNYLTVPDENAFDITGDIDIRVQVALDDWTPAAIAYVLGKSTAVQYSYVLQVNTSGTLSLLWSPDGGTTVITKTSTVAPTIGNGQPLWIRATLDVDNGASGYDVQFFTSTNGTTWTQLGTTVTTAGTTSIFSGTAEIRIGRGASGTQLMIGKHYRAQILNGIDGTTVLDVDTSVITSGGATSFTAGTGQTVTIERATSGRKTVAVTTPVWLFGTDDQLLVPGSTTGSRAVDFNNNDSFTVLAVIRQWATPTSNGTYLSKYDVVGGFGYLISRQTTGANNRLVIETPNISIVATSVAAASGSFATIVGIRNTTTNTITSQTNTTAGTAVTDTTNRNLTTVAPLSVGRRGIGVAGSATYQDFEFVAAAVFRRVLSAPEITTLQTYYLDRWK